MAQIAGGRVFQMLWTANSKRTPSKLSPGSSNDSSSGGCGTKSPLIADGVELDEVGQIHWTPLVKNLMHQRCKLEFDMVLNRQPVNLVGLPWYVTGGQDPAQPGGSVLRMLKWHQCRRRKARAGKNGVAVVQAGEDEWRLQLFQDQDFLANVVALLELFSMTPS